MNDILQLKILLISWFAVGLICTLATVIKAKINGDYIKDDLKYVPIGILLGYITFIIIVIVLLEDREW